MFQHRPSLGQRLSSYFWRLVILAVCLWPTWIYLLMRSVTEPQGFWQNFFLLGLGLIVLGTAQLIFALIALYFIFIFKW